MVIERQYSVVIPAYNAEATILDALRSVAEQTVPPAEVILVDDGSNDTTAELAEASGARVFRQKNQGPGAATTLGMSHATSAFIATLDADDIWLPQKLELQFAALESDGELSAVFGQMADFSDSTDNAQFDRAYDGWTRTTMLVRREVALATGAVIDPPGNAGDMVDWLARLRENGFRNHMMKSVLAFRRVRPGSLTYGRRAANMQGYLHVAREALKRRREKQPKDN